MNTTRKRNQRRHLAGASAVVAIATAALACGAAAPANAGTGISGGGVRNLSIVPDVVGANWGVPGTTGTLQFKQTDGTYGSPYTMGNGDWFTWITTLPAGMKFGSSACDGLKSSGEEGTWSCDIATDQATMQLRYDRYAPWEDTLSLFAFVVSPNVPVVSTGPVWGNATSSFTQSDGFAPSSSPSATKFVAGTPPVDGLSAGTPDGSGDIPLTGAGVADGTVTVKDASGSTVGSATVDGSGNWSVMIPNGTVPPLSTIQSVGGVESIPVQFN